MAPLTTCNRTIAAKTMLVDARDVWQTDGFWFPCRSRDDAIPWPCGSRVVGGILAIMVVERAALGLTPTMRRRIGELRAEASRLRAELGEPEEALSAFVRAHFDRDALAAALQDELDHVTEAVDDDHDSTVDR